MTIGSDNNQRNANRDLVGQGVEESTIFLKKSKKRFICVAIK